MPTWSTKQSSNPFTVSLSSLPGSQVKRELTLDEAQELIKVIQKYSDDCEGFILKHCNTLYLGPPPRYEPLPDKPHVRDLIKLCQYLPIGRALVLGKSRQVNASWLVCCYVAWCLLTKSNFNCVWSSLKEEHAHAILDRIKNILDRLGIITPFYEKTGNYIVIPALGNTIRAVPRGDTQITSFAYSLWVADEFAKIQPAKLQDKIFREAMPALSSGQVFFISSAMGDTLFEAMYFEP